MRPILLLGGGGHCHSCIDVIESSGIYRVEGIIESELSSESVLGYPVVGCDDDLPQLLKTSQSAIVAVGQIKNPETRIKLFDRLKKLGANLPVIISPKACCSSHSFIGKGSIVMHGAVINAGAKIGNNCIINSLSLIEHDVIISDHCHVSTGALVNGGAYIGRGTFVGSGAVVKEGVIVGENVIIGAGQIVLKDLQSGAVLKNAR